jgi:nucleotide-binding universal stress UspA family protein
MWIGRKEIVMANQPRMNILLADDGSEHAQSAVAMLSAFLLPPRTRVHAVRVFPSQQIDSLGAFERALDRTRTRLEENGFTVNAEVLLGLPAEKILEIAETDHPNLIVLGAKGLRATLGILLGGVAQHVVEYACCPVLIVRAPCEELRRVLLVTDGSSSSLNATRYLARFPLPEDIDLRVMHVVPPLMVPIMMEPYFGGWKSVYATIPEEEIAELREKRTKNGNTLLERTVKLLARRGLTATPVLAEGDAATEIIEYAKSNEVDLVVAGSRGLSQLKSLWVGSVSRKIVHYASCSVMIVKEPRKE